MGAAVSIARRRLVVLRRQLLVRLLAGGNRFNRPQAISCLATLDQDLARLRQTWGFNRPQAISCLATLCSRRRDADHLLCFNRPQAISCLATRHNGSLTGLQC